MSFDLRRADSEAFTFFTESHGVPVYRHEISGIIPAIDGVRFDGERRQKQKEDPFCNLRSGLPVIIRIRLRFCNVSFALFSTRNPVRPFSSAVD